MHARDNDIIPGIHARLGDLGQIDFRYDIAISTVCRSLNHVVIDTAETAHKCIRMLREKNAGGSAFASIWESYASKISEFCATILFDSF